MKSDQQAPLVQLFAGLFYYRFVLLTLNPNYSIIMYNNNNNNVSLGCFEKQKMWVINFLFLNMTKHG